MSSHSSTRISGASIPAKVPCARCIRLRRSCRVSPGYRVCDACVVIKRPCVFRSSGSSIALRLRERITSIRSELTHMMRLLDTLNDSNPLGAAVDDTFFGKSHLIDTSFSHVADSMSVDIADDTALVSEPTVQANSLADIAPEPFSSVADDPPTVALPAGSVAETIFSSDVSLPTLASNDWNTDEALASNDWNTGEALAWFSDLVAS
jgi:hypothetical protein